MKAIKWQATLIVKKRASSKSLTHVPVLIPYFKVQYIEPEEYPVEMLSNSLQNGSYNALNRLLTKVVS